MYESLRHQEENIFINNAAVIRNHILKSSRKCMDEMCVCVCVFVGGGGYLGLVVAPGYIKLLNGYFSQDKHISTELKPVNSPDAESICYCE